MKNYVFLAITIARIGGAELYISRKLEFLKKKGYECQVFYIEPSKGDIRIDNLKEFSDNCIPELRIPVGNLNKKRRVEIINNIISKIDSNSETIIECSNPQLGIWGEYLAEKTKGKNIVYILTESLPSPSKKLVEFYRFKDSQGLLFCINNKVFDHIPLESKDRVLAAVGCSLNIVFDYPYDELKKYPKADYTILCIGRLEKPYNPNVFSGISSFARENNSKSINLIVVGDSPQLSSKNNLRRIVGNINNLNVIWLGYLWPIPLEVFKQSDVLIASAGAAHVGANIGINTISIDSHDHEAIGVLGKSTFNSAFRDKNEPLVSVSEMLERVLINKEFGENEINCIGQVQLDYTRHIEIVKKSVPPLYYPVENTKKLMKYYPIRQLAIKLDSTKLGKRIFDILLNRKYN